MGTVLVVELVLFVEGLIFVGVVYCLLPLVFAEENVTEEVVDAVFVG